MTLSSPTPKRLPREAEMTLSSPTPKRLRREAEMATRNRLGGGPHLSSAQVGGGLATALQQLRT